MPTPKALSRIAGVVYLVMSGAAFNEFYVLGRLVAPGDAATTADRIRSSATLFRLGFLGDLVTGTLWVVLAMTLYLLLRDVHGQAAGAMVVFAAIGGGMQCFNQLNQYTALTVATGGDYTRAFGRAGADALTALFADMQHNGYVIDAMFFGLWLLPLGYLVAKSGYFPKILGILLVVSCVSYVATLFVLFLVPGSVLGSLLLVPAGLGEFAFMLWLLARGARVPESGDAHTAAPPVTGSTTPVT